MGSQQHPTVAEMIANMILTCDGNNRQRQAIFAIEKKKPFFDTSR
jgi:hypothetical protein